MVILSLTASPTIAISLPDIIVKILVGESATTNVPLALTVLKLFDEVPLPPPPPLPEIARMVPLADL
jgi:hypothetical protein